MVNLWVRAVAGVLSRCDFLPPWSFDYFRTGYAEVGGSVGPHLDHYCVFLLQGSWQRRWQISESANGEMSLGSDTSLKVLENFVATDEWILNPGDMLYLPPKVAHHGVAVGECTTFSVGFRAPAATEMLDDLATELLSRDIVPNHLTDPPLSLIPN